MARKVFSPLTVIILVQLVIFYEESQSAISYRIVVPESQKRVENYGQIHSNVRKGRYRKFKHRTPNDYEYEDPMAVAGARHHGKMLFPKSDSKALLIRNTLCQILRFRIGANN